MSKKKKENPNILLIGSTVYIGHQGVCIECIVDRDIGTEQGTFYRLVSKEDSEWSCISSVSYIHKSKLEWEKIVKTKWL